MVCVRCDARLLHLRRPKILGDDDGCLSLFLAFDLPAVSEYHKRAVVPQQHIEREEDFMHVLKSLHYLFLLH